MANLNAAESNRTSIKYLKEVTWGATPNSGTVREMRVTSSTLASDKKTKISAEIRADRMVSNIIEVADATAGDVNFEFSSGSVDDFLQSFLLGSWSQSMNFWLVKGASVTVTGSSQITITGADWTNWLTVNQYIKLEGFLNLANNGFFKVSAKSFSGGNTVITTTETSLVSEGGSAYTKAMDANDVFYKATNGAFAAGNKITGATNAFQNKGLQPGQKIHISTLIGKETGTIVCNVTDPTDGNTITVSDGVNIVVFEAQTSAANTTPGNVFVQLSGTEATFAANIAAATNDMFRQQKLHCSATVSTATVTITNHKRTGGSIAASDDAASVTVTNFSGGSVTKGGTYTIAAIPDNQTIQVLETLTADTNSGTKTIVLRGSHVRNPGTVASITKQSHAIQQGFTDVAKYFLFNGMRCGHFSLKLQAGDIVTGSLHFMGGQTTVGTTDVLGNTGSYSVLPSTATEVYNATANVGSILKNGSALSTAVMEIELTGEATLREQPAVGSKYPVGIGYGRFTLGGTIKAYFNDLSFYTDFLNHSTVSLAFNFKDVDSLVYYFTIPAVKITSDPVQPTGIDKDVMEEMKWEAQRDPVYNTMFMVDRFSSFYPASVA